MTNLIFRLRCLMLLSLLCIGSIHAQSTRTKRTPPTKETDYQSKMKWFKDAKFGIFIHWGIYAVNGIPESWAFFNEYISYPDYMKQLDGFTAANYRAEQWGALIEESGAQYAIMTTKHHDGVALWDSKMGGYNVVEHTPAKRDLLTPWVNALRKRDLKVGLYYSLPDWSYPDYDVHTRNEKRYQLADQPERWERFRTYFQGQLKELSTRYNPDLWWFDGDWEHNAEEWQASKVRTLLMDQNPNIIINSRLTESYGDYATPEQGVPIVRPSAKYWELCYTMNDSWGYQDTDHNYKTSSQLIRILAECVGMGGNLLLDIGPKADGSIAPEQVDILKKMGAWNNKHARAVFGTEAGLPAGHFAGPSSLSADGKSLFLFVGDQPSQKLVIQNFKANVESLSILGKKTKPTGIMDGPHFRITLPAEECDDYVTVVELKLSKPFDPATDLIKKAVSTVPFKVLDIPELAGVRNNERWKTKHAEVLKSHSPGMPASTYWGVTTLSEDRETLYLFVNGKPNGSLMLKGLSNDIHRIRIVGNGTLLPHTISSKLYWSAVPGVVYIDVPEHELDEEVTVIAILLKGKLSVYTGESKAIESN